MGDMQGHRLDVLMEQMRGETFPLQHETAMPTSWTWLTALKTKIQHELEKQLEDMRGQSPHGLDVQMEKYMRGKIYLRQLRRASVPVLRAMCPEAAANAERHPCC